MAGFRSWKSRLGRELAPAAWPPDAPSMPPHLAALDAPEAVSALLSFLPRGGVFMWRAALVLGRVVPAMARADMESARVFMRRCMWHLNEDSGNLGWGVPETMGEIVARSPQLAAEYGKIVLSYVNDTGKADNYLDFIPLRRGAYWAVGRAAAVPALRAEGYRLLARGLHETDALARAMAAWGLGRLASVRAPEQDTPAADEVAAHLQAMRGERTVCLLLEGERLREETAGTYALEALHALTLPPRKTVAD